MKNLNGNFRRENTSKRKIIDKLSNDEYYKKMDHTVKDFPVWKLKWKRKRTEKEKKEKQKDRCTSTKRLQGKELTKSLRQALLATYKDSGDEEEEDKENNEAMSLFELIDSESSEFDVDRNSSQILQLGMQINRPPLFDGQYFNEWKACMEVFLHATDYDL